MSRQNVRRTARGFETLECRHALAGNVTVTQSGDTLTLVGDNLDNSVIIDSDVNGNIIVTGTSTTLNSDVVPQPLIYNGINNITATLNGGADNISVNSVNNLTLTNLTIDGGIGDDNIILGPNSFPDIITVNGQAAAVASGSLNVSGTITVTASDGNDYVQMYRVFGNAAWNINLGNDNDYLKTYWTSNGSLNVNAGSGNDQVDVGYMTVNNGSTMHGNDGNDLFSIYSSAFKADAAFYGDNGLDFLAADTNNFGATVLFNTGADADQFLFASNIVTAQVAILTDGGADQGTIGKHIDSSSGGNQAGQLVLDTGTENDQVSFGNNAFQNFYATFGNNDDRVSFDDYLYVKNRGVLDGAGGFDIYSTVSPLNLNIYSFESKVAAS